MKIASNYISVSIVLLKSHIPFHTTVPYFSRVFQSDTSFSNGDFIPWIADTSNEPIKQAPPLILQGFITVLENLPRLAASRQSLEETCCVC